jgi:hypothetical protein
LRCAGRFTIKRELVGFVEKGIELHFEPNSILESDDFDIKSSRVFLPGQSVHVQVFLADSPVCLYHPRAEYLFFYHSFAWQQWLKAKESYSTGKRPSTYYRQGTLIKEPRLEKIMGKEK